MQADPFETATILREMRRRGAQYGMVTMDQHLAELVRAKRIALDTALEQAANPEDLRNLLGIKVSTDGSAR